MNIKTKFNVGDNVLFTNYGNIVSSVIQEIKIEIDDSINIMYKIKNHSYYINEDFIFKDAKDMYNQLKKQFPIINKHEKLENGK